MKVRNAVTAGRKIAGDLIGLLGAVLAVSGFALAGVWAFATVPRVFSHGTVGFKLPGLWLVLGIALMIVGLVALVISFVIRGEELRWGNRGPVWR